MPLSSKLMGIFWPLGLNSIYFVFPTFTDILLARNQLAIFWSSELILFIRDGRSVSESTTAVSSANRKVRSRVARWRSLIKQRNRMGPKILPCNTDMSIGSSVDLDPLISVYCILLER